MRALELRQLHGNPRILLDLFCEAACGAVVLKGGDLRVLWKVGCGPLRELVRTLSRQCGEGLFLRQLATTEWLTPGGDGMATAEAGQAFRLLRFAYGSPSLLRSDGGGGIRGLWVPTVWKPCCPWLEIEMHADGAVWTRLCKGGRLVRKRRLTYWGG